MKNPTSTARQAPIEGPASLISRQLRTLGLLYLQSSYGLDLKSRDPSPGVVFKLGSRRYAIAVSRRPDHVKLNDALIYVPKIHLVAKGVRVVGFSCIADIDHFNNSIGKVTSLDMAGYLPSAIISRYPANGAGLIAVPYAEFKPMRPKDVRV